LYKTPFDYFKEYWDKTVICAKQILFRIEEAITLFLSDLDSLFEIYTDNGYVQFAYFGPELRISIMKAGRTQTLLKIRYKGYDRVVEPYSLKYLQTKDGTEREYLYVYNRTGGESQPGIRCFIAERIEFMENTEENFEPRYPIELSKAGEMPENPYLFDPNKPVLAPKLRTRVSVGTSKRTFGRSSFGPKYIYINVVIVEKSLLKACSIAISVHTKTRMGTNVAEDMGIM
jgi:hypothetical protein